MILLDSHVVIWLGVSPERVSPAASHAIALAETSGETMAISAACLYEIVNAIRRGRVRPAVPLQSLLTCIRNRFRVLPVSGEIAVMAAELADPFHGDPMDRLIAATAIMENCTLITADRMLLGSKVCKTLW